MRYLNLNLQNYQFHVDERLKAWKKISFNQRLWEKDPMLWFPEQMPEIADRLGWLRLPETMSEKLDELASFSEDVKKQGFSHVVLLGMGGSSLAPEVYQRVFGNCPGYPELMVLDSTHPSAISVLEEKIDLSQTLFLVSSKSGTTIETLSFFRYFWSLVEKTSKNPGRHFVAITDPGTPLMEMAQKREFRAVFKAPPDVGGRFSALTVFGLVPAALIGIDIHTFLARARVAMEHDFLNSTGDESLGLTLGASLGEVALSRDKLTILTSLSLTSFPDWIEQLIAESTGKDDKGIIPVVNEAEGPDEFYGDDRFFVGIFLKGDEKEPLFRRLDRLEKNGHPIIRIGLNDKHDLSQEILQWEIGVASAGSILGIHPFNQPDVQLAKDFTCAAMDEISGKNTADKGQIEETLVTDFASLASSIKKWKSQVKTGDYIAIHAYLHPAAEISGQLEKVRFEMFKQTRVATTLDYGPRFLHSTGQLHKGGPNKGIFLQLVDEPSMNLRIPEANYSFDSLIQAQAIGDFQALLQRKRRVLRINLGKDTVKGLERLLEVI